jgi:PEP-CTERM motif
MNAMQLKTVFASLAAMTAIFAASSFVDAQVTGLLSAQGQVYFSSDNDAYNYASPLSVTNPGTGLTTVNALDALNGIPGAPLGGNANALIAGNSFSFTTPTAYIQADPLVPTQQTIAGVTVKATAHPLLLPYVTAPRVQAYPFTGLHQGSTAPGYALEQFDFDAFYSVGSAGVLPAVKTITANINGNLVNSGVVTPFAEFGYEINYYEDVGSNTTYLGTASAFQSWNVAGPFSATITGSPSSINGFTYSTSTGAVSVLEVTGTMFMAGDPASFDADVEDDIPEPASLGLMATAGLLILRRRRA